MLGGNWAGIQSCEGWGKRRKMPTQSELPLRAWHAATGSCRAGKGSANRASVIDTVVWRSSAKLHWVGLSSRTLPPSLKVSTACKARVARAQMSVVHDSELTPGAKGTEFTF